MSPPYQKAHFLLSVANIKQLPPDTGIEIAFVGRSNAGKSSIINRLTKNKSLARTSKTPGRTQHINLFGMDDTRRIVDLPGYGYAKVPLAAKLKWQKTVDEYIETRTCLKGLVLIMDIRHPMRDSDLQLLEYCEARDLPVHVILNKSDKLSRGGQAKVIQEVAGLLTDYTNSVTLQGFSALKGSGIKELITILDTWYQA